MFRTDRDLQARKVRLAHVEKELADQKQQLERLRSFEAITHAIGDVASECYYEFKRSEGGSELELDWITGPVLRVLGHERDQVRTVGQWLSKVNPEDRQQLKSHFKALEAGDRHSAEFRVLCGDGSSQWVRMTSMGVCDGAGTLERAYGVAKNFTPGVPEAKPRVEATDTRRDVTAEQLKAAVETAVQPMFWIHMDGRIVFANAAAEGLTGFTVEELATMNVRDLDPTMSSDKWRVHVEVLLSTGSRITESAFMGPDGRRIVQVHDSYVEVDGQGYIFSTASDITKPQLVRTELQSALENAERLSKLKTEFLSSISHDVRTPLTAIIGFSSMLDDQLPEQPRKFLKFIERSGRRLLGSLNSIQNLAMMDSGDLDLRREIMNAEEVVRDQIALFQPLVEEKGLTLTYHAPKEEVELYVDKASLERIISNILSNAVNFTAEGRIDVRLVATEDAAEIIVVDTGVGMASDFVGRAFDEFQRWGGPDGVAPAGIGLGLTIARRLAELMSGSIDLESAPGTGTKVTVAFPRQTGQRRRSDQAERSEADTGDASPRSNVPARVLAVEDNRDMLALFRALLSRRFEVSTAVNQKTALEQLAAKQFDVVLMDINLGANESGVDVLHELRKMPNYADVPVVAVTAYALPGDRERFLKEGFDGYIGKPFTRQQLFRMLERILTT